MKKLVPVTALLMLVLSAFSQEQPNLLSASGITTIGYWNRGDKITYHVTNSQITTKSGATQAASPSSSSSYDIELAVVDSTAHTYVLEMKYLSGSSEGLDPKLQEVMNSLQIRTKIRYQTDEFGSYEKILNMPELQAEIKKVFAEFKKKASEHRTPEEAKVFASKMDALLVQFSKPENVEVLYLPDILEIHAYYGIQLELNKPMEVAMEFPCFEQINVPGTGKITLQSITKTKDNAAFSITSKPDKEALKKYMKLFFEQLYPDASSPVSVDEMNIDFENKERLVIRLSNGWMESIEKSQTIVVSSSKEKLKKVTTKRFTRK